MGKKSRKTLAVAQTSNLQHDDNVKEQGKHFLRLSTRTLRLTITPDVPLAVADAVKEEDEPRVPWTEFFVTPVVSTIVGTDDNQKTFYVHEAIFEQSSISWNYDDFFGGSRHTSIPDVDDHTFGLALEFFYTGQYTERSLSLPTSKAVFSGVSELETHANLYCFAKKYKFERLVNETTKNINGLKKVSYLEVLAAARHVYSKLPDNEVWYRDYFKKMIGEALDQNVEIVDSPSFLEPCSGDHPLFVADLLEALLGCIRKVRMSRIPQPDDKSDPVNETPCGNRQKHLKSLKGGGPWRDCRKCRLERDRMMTTGRAMMSVVFTDIWPDFGEDTLRDTVDPNRDPEGRKAKKKMRKILKEALCQIPSDRIMTELTENRSEQCPDQSLHLQKNGGKWLWEDCAQCLHSRRLMRQAILSHFPIGDEALSGLVMLQDSNAADDERLPKDDDPDRAIDHDFMVKDAADTPRDELMAEERAAIDVPVEDTHPGQPGSDDDPTLDMPTGENYTIRDDYAVLTPTETNPEYCAFAEVEAEARKVDTGH